VGGEKSWNFYYRWHLIFGNFFINSEFGGVFEEWQIFEGKKLRSARVNDGEEIGDEHC